VVSTDGMGVSLAVRSDMFEASNQRDSDCCPEGLLCGRWWFCVCERVIEAGRDAVDDVQQARRAV
jgi:hypothetical protein